MKGQWLGTYSGTNKGTITLNLDEMDDHFAGNAILHCTSAKQPILVVPIATASKKPSGRFKATNPFHLDPATGARIAPADLATKYPALTFPTEATIDYAIQNSDLSFSWTTPVGSSGSASLARSKAGEPSDYKAKVMTWPKFKAFAELQPYRKTIFRGQERDWRLRTTFHRNSRADLDRYTGQDMRALHAALAARTRHSYDLRIPEENAAFLHLAQHHGYPTPLLDWSFSPYVAAFCAFRRVRSDPEPNEKVRIFMFDHSAWQRDYQQILLLATTTLHLSILESIAFDNDRSGPQQALSLLTNIDDVETYIRNCETKRGKTFLTVIDILASERDAVIRDLARMGISAGSMFPGLDGACEELKERLFPRW